MFPPTSNVVDPSCSLHDKDVVCHEAKVHRLEHQENMPALNNVRGVVGDDDRSDQLWRDNCYACRGGNPSQEVDRTAPVALDAISSDQAVTGVKYSPDSGSTSLGP